MIKEIYFVWWFFAPAGIANIAAFFSGKIPLLKSYSYPIDFNVKVRGRRIFGSNKTMRGLIFGIISAIAIVYLQVFLFNQFAFIKKIIPLDYNSINPILLGGLAGFGALFGDALKSFFKRQIGVEPGRSWFPFDQIDYILGGILFTSFYINLSRGEYVTLLWVWFLLHPLTTLLGYVFKLKDSPL